MSKPYQNIETKKSTTRIEAELFDRVTSHFHHGQQTALFRNIFESLDVLLEAGHLIQVTNYIYKADSLTLKPHKD